MSYSSIANKSNIEYKIEAEIKESNKEQKIIDEYEHNQQQELLKNKNNKNKNKYKYKNNEETYNRNSNNGYGDNNQQNISQYNPDFCIQPRFTNIYNKKYCIKWLTINLDNNYYHYDYCIKLFEMLMKWVRYNNFVLKTGENPLLGKFISLMYLLSNKKGYGYSLM
jgi:hypothetical protein